MSEEPRQIGRYAMYGVLASGGMATVHFGRLAGAAGFARTVAIKALRPQYAEDPEFVSMFIDEARLAARIHHPNVVPTLDVVSNENELFTVMDYVHGETLSRLIRASRGTTIPLSFVIAIMRDVLNGLHAAHESTDEQGQPLGVVHRDVSPQNVIVGADGVARVLDFGVAKAAGRIQTTREGELKGKIAYMAPEQFSGSVSRSSDVFAASVVLWEAIVGDKLFSGANEGEIIAKILHHEIPSPRTKRLDLPVAIEAIVMRGLARAPEDRFATALEMSNALVQAQEPARIAEVGEWVTGLAAETLHDRETLIREMETQPHISARIAANVIAQIAKPAAEPAPERSFRSRAIFAFAFLAAAIVISVWWVSRAHSPSTTGPTSDPSAVLAVPTTDSSRVADPESSSSIHAVPPPTSTNIVPPRIVGTTTAHHLPLKASSAPATTTAPDHI
ncbi:MAG: serine/threonine-protein kinase [Polyangiaceae bacterium]